MNILVIEDDRRLVEILRQALEEEGHQVTTALDGRSGLNFAMNSSFDVLLLDLMLPGVDGFMIARELRAAPERIFSSVALMLAARVRTSTSPRPGIGTGASRQESTSGPPNRS